MRLIGIKTGPGRYQVGHEIMKLDIHLFHPIQLFPIKSLHFFYAGVTVKASSFYAINVGKSINIVLYYNQYFVSFQASNTFSIYRN